jgi:outer membrane receptor protein involved in Fe transport
MSVRLDSASTLKASGGLYYQSATYDQLLAADRHHFSPPSMQKAYHAVVGIERPLRGDLNFRLDIFYKRLLNIMALKQHENGELELSGRNDSEAKISGADIEVSFSDSRVMGWLNLSILYADERNTMLGEGWRPRVTDQRRTLSTTFEYRISPRFSCNLRAYYGGGYPLLNDTTRPFGYALKHQPEYKRLDLGARYTIPVKNCKLTFILDIQNVFNYRNVAMFFGKPPKESGFDWYLLLPRVINVGMKFEF